MPGRTPAWMTSGAATTASRTSDAASRAPKPSAFHAWSARPWLAFCTARGRPRDSAVDRFYRFLLSLYPAHFREEYADEMARLFRDRLRREGWWRLFLETIPDLLLTAWREHMDTLRRDILYSLRSLAKNPGFAAMA